MLELDGIGKLLVIADVHQNLGYVRELLLKESDYDHVIFLGDYFDTFHKPDSINYFNVGDTARYFSTLAEELGDKATWLIGNHDLAYLSSYYIEDDEMPKRSYLCSGYTLDKANEFNAAVDEAWIDRWKLSARIDNYYFSHAGWHITHFNRHEDPEAGIERLTDEWEAERKTFYKTQYHWIATASRNRGGYARFGSPLWLDWSEFSAIEGINQIVGHSNSLHWVVRNQKQNYCIDCNQQMYCTVENGLIRLGKIKPSDSKFGEYREDWEKYIAWDKAVERMIAEGKLNVDGSQKFS